MKGEVINKPKDKPKKITETVNELEKQVAELKEKNTRLEKFVQQQSMLLEQTVSRLNRVDAMQIQMDVMLRNHQHERGE